MLPSAPAECGVRVCVGNAVVKHVKGIKKARCDFKSHHEAYLVRGEGGDILWEWTTRGRSGLKGTLVDEGPGQQSESREVITDTALRSFSFVRLS